MAKTLKTNIRWMIRRDMPEVLAIEEGSYEWPWVEDDFIRLLRQRNCIGMIIECGDVVIGFMVYELEKTYLKLLTLTVHPCHRRLGIGAELVEKLKNKLSTHRRNRIVLSVRETNTAAQLFFSSCGFMAVKVLRSEYEDNREDGYEMEFRVLGDYPIKKRKRRVIDADLTNRVTDYFRRK